MNIRVTKKSNPNGDGVIFYFHDIDDKATAIAMAEQRINQAKLHQFNETT